MRGKRTCYNCSRSRIIPGRQIDEFNSEPDVVDCIDSKVDYRLLDKYYRNALLMPRLCKRYDPKLIKRCEYCGQEINKPMWNWPFWVRDVFEHYAVCSPECQDAFKNKISKEMGVNYDDFFKDDQEWLVEDDFPY